MLVKIFQLDEGTSGKPLCTLGNGIHVLGRGALLQCPDKRVSRNHIELVVNSDNINLTSKHPINPCFFRSGAGRSITILKFDLPVNLQTGDTFGFFPDQYWFRINISNDNIKDEDVNINESSCNSVSKAIKLFEDPISDPNVENSAINAITNFKNNILYEHENQASTSTNDAESSEIIKDEVVTNVISNVDVEPSITDNLGVNVNGVHEDTNQASTSNNTESSELLKNKALNNVDSKDMKVETLANNVDGDSDNVETQENALNFHEADTDVESGTEEAPKININEVKEEVLSADDEPVVNNELKRVLKTENGNEDDDCSKTNKVQRDRCWYAPNCYRKNPVHKKKFSHPDDSDYDTDLYDNRPSCSYGENCYRRNILHRQDYKHPQGTFSKKVNRPPKRPHPNVDQSSNEDGIDVNNITTAKRKRKKVARTEEPSEDDYDMEDPFIDDGSDDEYMESSDDSDY